MAYFRIEYFSNALRRATSFEMLLPNDYRQDVPFSPPQKPMGTLFLLHGYTGKAGNWVPEELAVRHNFAVVMPTAENSFYLNGEATGSAYQTMVGEELVDYVRRTFGLASGRENTCIAGMSMGGFGALHTALAYPDTFGKLAGLSSALIVHGIAHMRPGQDNGMANYAYYRQCFGDLETVESRDFLLENNRQMHRFLLDEKIDHQYFESAGRHDMVFWNEYIVKAVNWMFG